MSACAPVRRVVAEVIRMIQRDPMRWEARLECDHEVVIGSSRGEPVRTTFCPACTRGHEMPRPDVTDALAVCSEGDNETREEAREERHR